MALRLLDAVLRAGVPLESALGRAGGDVARSEDRAFAWAIAAEALRRLPDLDALIDRATSRPLPPDAKARFVLRLALVQALRLGTPAHAVLATSLPLVAGGPRRLVHGIVSRVLREGWALPEIPALPELVAERWRLAWGEANTAAAARLIADPPPVDLSFARPEAVAGLDGVSLLPGHLRLPRGGPVPAIDGYGEGHWWVQDLAASLPARMLGPGAGRSALDLCAAPGGKSMQLAAAGWRVTAIDRSAGRMARLAENLARTRLEAELTTADLLEWEPAAPADAILLDAPCSATGIFRRHPDVIHRLRAGALESLAGMQREMLERASHWLKPGGSLVYSVCSLEPEEGEEVVAAFLAARSDYRLAEERRVLPVDYLDAGGADGFYMARFSRN